MLINFVPNLQSNQVKSAAAPIDLEKVIVIVLGGGEGKRLDPLTRSRCKPAVKFGGHYALIDVPISHALTSGLRHIFVIGQYMAYTLQKHLTQTYASYMGAHQSLQLLVPEEREHEKVWYQGTADAVRKNLEHFRQMPGEYFLILSGDQLYNIDFQQMIQFGVNTQADMVIAAQPVTEKNAKRMGLMQIDGQSFAVQQFIEKPQDPKVLNQFYVPTQAFNSMGLCQKPAHNYLGSMGIYLFKRQALFSLLEEDNREDFGKHLIETQMRKGGVFAYLYDGYWEDIGTIESYYYANIALTHHGLDPQGGLDCYDESRLIVTPSQNLPPAKIGECRLHDAIICQGAVVEAREVINSIIGERAVIDEGVVIKDSIILGNEFYKRPAWDAESEACEPKIGKNSLIYKSIIDENVTIGHSVKLVNQNQYKDYDSPDGKLYVRDGIIVVPKGTKIPDHYTF
jgi:glucose-1-phosphate adenylyltransferase